MVAQELQPKLESMEASWFRLHAITAADTAEEVVAFWEGMLTHVPQLSHLKLVMSYGLSRLACRASSAVCRHRC